MTNSSLAVRPAHRNVPPADTELAERAVHLVGLAGLELDEWQRAAFLDACGVRDGRWAALEVGLIVPRQNGKGSLLEARELAGLFLFGERLILHSAHEFKTASEAFLRIHQLIDGCPDLSKLVRRVYTAHGQEGIELTSGQRLKFVARSKGSGRGFSGDCVILDEAYNLSDKAIAALMPTLSARDNPQIWYTSSAPLASEESDVLRRLCKRGRKGADRLAYIEYCSENDDPREANPAHGIRIFDDFIEAERAVLSPEDFARERCGVWTENEVDAVIPIDRWEACVDMDARAVSNRCFAFDVTPDGSSASVAVCATDGNGKPYVELIARERGSRWLLERLPAIVEKWEPTRPPLYDPASPAGALVPEMVCEVEGVKLREHAHACSAFLTSVTDERLRHRGQVELKAAVQSAGKRDVGDVWLWSRSRSTADITPLVAATLAHWGHMPPEEEPRTWFGGYA